MTEFEVYQLARLLVRGLAVAFVPVTGTLLALWLHARARARAAERLLDARGAAQDVASAGRDARLERVEQAVEAVALEVERVAEVQRFTARLLADRLGERVAERPAERVGGLPASLPAPPGGRIVTPH